MEIDEPVRLTRFLDSDSVEDLTRLLHRAYAAHAASSLRFFASYQSVDDTRHRLGEGECWVAWNKGGEMVGTVTVAAPFSAPAGYPVHQSAGSFWQLAVDPSGRGRGLGRRMVKLAESRARARGLPRMVIDTSADAGELVSWYRRHGYVPVGMWRWSVTNYDSVVLGKALGTTPL
ncbi:GNAT family N-acetyltransferase [Streptomyces sp. S1]|uniref:GNAT family N-acetyltransferase n=1 Tax=Streptomyces sp. S1 TaxID=718288 RepID=UPI003D72213A